MVSLMGGSSRPTSSNSQGRRSRSQSRSRSRAASEADPAETSGHSSSSNANIAVGNTDPTMDFCNNFWSHGGRTESGGSGQDGAYDALMSRMKSSGKMVEDFKAFFKERLVRCGLASSFRTCRSDDCIAIRDPAEPR